MTHTTTPKQTSVDFDYIFSLSVGVVIKALRKKIKSLEDDLQKEEELKIHLTTNQEEALQKMAEASAAMELRAAEEKKELEEHFSQLLQKVTAYATMENKARRGEEAQRT